MHTSDDDARPVPASRPVAATRLSTATVVVPGGSDTARGYRRLFGLAEGVEPVVANGAVVVDHCVDRPVDDTARIVFGCGDLDRTRRLLERRGLALSPHAAGLVARQYPALGVGTRAATADCDPERDVDRIDHVVFTAPDRVQAIALFGGVLGLDFRLAQSTRGVEQLFFRATEVVVEVLAGVEGADDGVALWGVAWRSVDLETTRARLVESGVDVSEIRPGRKPGTRVATVRDDALGTATLLIEHVRHA